MILVEIKETVPYVMFGAHCSSILRDWQFKKER